MPFKLVNEEAVTSTSIKLVGTRVIGPFPSGTLRYDPQFDEDENECDWVEDHTNTFTSSPARF